MDFGTAIQKMETLSVVVVAQLYAPVDSPLAYINENEAAVTSSSNIDGE